MNDVPRRLSMTMGVGAAAVVLVAAVSLAASFLRLPSNQVGGIAVAKLCPAPAILRSRDVVPIDRRVPGKDT